MPRPQLTDRRPRARQRGHRHPIEDPVAREPVAPVAGAPEPPPGTWRDEVAGASGINVLAGIWLIIAPFVLGYGGGDPYWNDIVFGAIVVVLAGVRALGAYRQAWMSWLNMLIGAWVFISAFWLDATARASWNDVILGAIIFVLGAVSASASAERPRRRTDPTLR
jgi:SPW repeat-containing protein